MPVIFWKRMVSVLALAGILGMGVVFFILYGNIEAMRLGEFQRMNALQLVHELGTASANLTNEVRSRVTLGEVSAAARYQQLLDVRNGTRPRPGNMPLHPGRSLSLIQIANESFFNPDEQQIFLDVLQRSEKLSVIEREAMRLVATAEREFGEDERSAHPDIAKATDLVFNEFYRSEIEQIQSRLDALHNRLFHRMNEEEDGLLGDMRLLTALLSVLFLLTATCLLGVGYLGHAGHVRLFVQNRQNGTSEQAVQDGDDSSLRLYTYIILSLVVSLGLPMAFVYADARGLMMSSLEKRQSLIAREVARELNLRMSMTIDLARIVSARPSVLHYLAAVDASKPDEELLPPIKELLNSVTRGYAPASRTFLLNDQGVAVIGTRGAEREVEGLRLGEENLTRLRSGKAFMTFLRMPSGMREFVVLSPVIQPVEGGVPRFLGVVFSVLDRRHSFQLWEDRLVPDERMNIFIIDQEGHVVLSSRGSERYERTSAEETAGRLAIEGTQGVAYYNDSLEHKRVGYFLPVPELKWTVAVTSAYASTTAGLHDLFVRALIFGSTAILVAIFLFTLLMQRMTHNLRKVQERSTGLMRTVGMFMWELDTVDRRFAYDPEWHRFMHLPGEASASTISLEAHLATIHPDDLGRVLKLLEAPDAPYLFDFEVRHLLQDGQCCWARIMTCVEARGADNRPVLLNGMGYDITAQKKVEESEAELKSMAAALHKSNERLENIIQVANMLTFDFDVVNGIFLHNAEWVRAWRYPGTEESGWKNARLVMDRVHPEYQETLQDIFRNHRAGDCINVDLLMHTYDDEWRWHRHQIRIEAVDENGHVERALGIGFDVTPQKLAEQSEADKKAQLERLVSLRTAELEESRNQAEAASQAKTAFLSTVSHEIRTPMNAIVGFAHIFDRSNLTQMQKDHLDKIRLSAGTLLGIINDVLDISKIEAGRLEFENRAFRLRNLLDAVLSIVGFAAASKDLPLHMQVADEVPDRLMGDDKRISQILLNLMNNAVKFTHAGHVRLEVSRLSHSDAKMALLEFRVHDTGIGLTDEQMGRLFKPFMQADSSVTRRFGGTGLGLAISRQLVELMGGAIGVQSTYGEGTTFHCTLCLACDEADEAESDADLAGGTDESPEQQARWAALRGQNVLVVEDNLINQEIARALLEEYGLEVDVAGNGCEALERVRQKHYSCLFMDMQMPIMDGLQATAELRAMGAMPSLGSRVNGDDDLSWLAHVPIVAMTANAMSEDRQRCLDVGMDDHLGKPIDPALLRECLFRWLVGSNA